MLNWTCAGCSTRTPTSQVAEALRKLDPGSSAYTKPVVEPPG
ncbi:MAG: hypothetical protein ACRDYX_08395 [Egibacteraceae bacterium]